MNCEKCGKLTPVSQNTAKGLCPECDPGQITPLEISIREAKRLLVEIQQLQAKIDVAKDENERLRGALNWLKTDMAYKAHEQAFDCVGQQWIPYIEQALKD